MTRVRAGLRSRSIEVHATRTEVDPIASLLPLLDARASAAVHAPRRGHRRARRGGALEFRGPDRIRDAADAWKRIARRVDGARRGRAAPAPGSSRSARSRSPTSRECASVLIVPRVVVGRRDGVSWVTRIDGATDAVGRDAHSAPSSASCSQPGALDARRLPGRGRRRRVDRILRRRRREGRARPRPRRPTCREGGDVRRVLRRPRRSATPTPGRSPSTACIGSSPETLVRVNARHRHARACSPAARRAGPDAATDAAAALDPRHLDQGPRRAPVRRRERARALCARTRADVAASELPFTLKLPNLWHLASDVEGALDRRLDRARPRGGPAPDRGRRGHPARRRARADRRTRAPRPLPLRRAGRLGRRRRQRQVGDRAALRAEVDDDGIDHRVRGRRHRRRLRPRPRAGRDAS